MFVLSGSLTPVSLSHPQLLRRAGSFPGVNPPGAAAESSPDSSGRLGAGFTGSSKCRSPKGNVGTEPWRGQPQKHLVWPREPTGRAQHPPVQALPFPEHPPQACPACAAPGAAAAPRLDPALPGTGTQGTRAQPWALPPRHAIPGTSCRSCSVLDKRWHTPATNQPCSARG